MRRFQKAIFAFAVMLVLMSLAAPIGYAQIIPKESKCATDDKGKLTDEGMKNALGSEGGFDEAVKAEGALSGILGCAVKTGKIRLYMVPFFITYLIQFLLSIAGLVAVLFMVIGGYKYVVGGLTEDKESGKKTILHALVGFIVALSAWIVVNFIQVALTS